MRGRGLGLSMLLLAGAPNSWAAPAAVPLSRPDQAIARFGQTVLLGPVRVTPLALVEDSRCPSDVHCIWAGQVWITARIATGARVEILTLAMGERVAVAGGALTLAYVLPVRRLGTAATASNYRFAFTWSTAG